MGRELEGVPAGLRWDCLVWIMTWKNSCHHHHLGCQDHHLGKRLPPKNVGVEEVRELCDVGEGGVSSRMNTVSAVVKAEPSLALSLLCPFRYKPSCEVRTFHENSSRL